MPRSFKNLVDLYEQSCRDFADKELFGVKRDGAWSYMTYAAFKQRVDDFRGGLKKLGIGAGDRVAIIADNSVEWAVAAYATYGLRATFVPMYEAQPPDEWIFILNDCTAKAVICARKAILDTILARKVEVPLLEHVLGIDLPADDGRAFKTIESQGSAAPTPAEHPAPGEIAGFIYTSGTTGMPKGVVLTHANFCCNVNDVNVVFPLSSADRSLAFLYWAHAFGQTAELHSLLSIGLSIAINDSIDNLVGNLAEVKPTVLIAVPRIFNRVYAGITRQMEDKPAPIRALFRAGVAAATRRSRGETIGPLAALANSLADALIFRKVRAKLGGRLRFAVSGSAALSKEVAEFVDALGIDVYEGYGLSEASPVVTTNSPGHQRIGSVGRALPSVRLAIDTEVTGDPENGEIIIYGDNVMQGYHNRPEESARAFTADRGLRSGDMGRLDAEGYLYITGRIKEQYKLENGKYVVPSPLEEQLKLSPYIANVMLFGENRAHNVAVVVPNLEGLERWAKQQGRPLGNPEGDAEVKALLKAELDRLSQSFKSYERPKNVLVVKEDFTVQNGMLTPSLKVKRRTVVKKYEQALQALY